MFSSTTRLYVRIIIIIITHPAEFPATLAAVHMIASFVLLDGSFALRTPLRVGRDPQSLGHVVRVQPLDALTAPAQLQSNFVIPIQKIGTRGRRVGGGEAQRAYGMSFATYNCSVLFLKLNIQLI